MASLVAPELKIILCQGLYKPPLVGGELSWHQDDAYFEIESRHHRVASLVSCWVTFDDATLDSSCLWVVPGGHERGVREHERRPDGLTLAAVDEDRAVPIEVRRQPQPKPPRSSLNALLGSGFWGQRRGPSMSPRPPRRCGDPPVPD